MNLRLVQFSLGPDSRSTAESIAGKIVPRVRTLDGCESCTFFADYEAGDYGIVVLWASREAAGAAAAVMSPILTEALAGAQSRAESRRLYEVYEPA